MLNKLYVRIWLAVVLAVLVVTLLVGWVWRLAAEPPVRDLEVRNEAGQLIGRGRPRQMMEHGAWRHSPELRDLMRRYAPWRSQNPSDLDDSAAEAGVEPPRDRKASTANNVAAFLAELEHLDATGRLPASPEFVVRMRDGQVMRMHLMRGPPTMWSRPPFGFAWMLVWVAIAVALATYPIVRKLTRRLERLQDGVQQWGEGN